MIQMFVRTTRPTNVCMTYIEHFSTLRGADADCDCYIAVTSVLWKAVRLIWKSERSVQSFILVHHQ